MTLYCSVCGEPWELDSLHTETERRMGFPSADGQLTVAGKRVYDAVFGEVREDFYKRGCEALNATHNAEGKPTPAAAAVYEAYGEDVDAAAGDMEWARGWFDADA